MFLISYFVLYLHKVYIELFFNLVFILHTCDQNVTGFIHSSFGFIVKKKALIVQMIANDVVIET